MIDINYDDIPVRNDMQTVAFYNIENLFDVYDDKHTHDGDFLPDAPRKWTPKRYEKKLRKIGYAISNIGRKETGKHPTLVGLAEVENSKVIEDLIDSKHLEDCNYGYVHYDSLDERGIDVALLYDKNAFEVTTSEPFTVILTDDDGSPDYTRDILLVSGVMDGEKVHVLVNHWSSRREGEKETEPKRIASSDKVREIISNLRSENEDAKIIVIGDFNDDPHSNSIKRLVEGSNLFNPMETLRSFNRGTTNYNKQWNLFDQILISTNYFRTSDSLYEYSSANIFDEDFLKVHEGRYKGTPYRTYVGKKHKGGYSDHFPVYAIFKK
ncbi:MAG: endonuclease/exonuclease/phosphatase family protein [Algibacter sp.]